MGKAQGWGTGVRRKEEKGCRVERKGGGTSGRKRSRGEGGGNQRMEGMSEDGGGGVSGDEWDDGGRTPGKEGFPGRQKRVRSGTGPGRGDDPSRGVSFDGPSGVTEGPVGPVSGGLVDVGTSSRSGTVWRPRGGVAAGDVEVGKRTTDSFPGVLLVRKGSQKESSLLSFVFEPDVCPTRRAAGVGVLTGSLPEGLTDPLSRSTRETMCRGSSRLSVHEFTIPRRECLAHIHV